MRCFTRLSSFLCVLALFVVLNFDVAHAALALPNDPPENPPFFGGYYITGYSTTLGDCTIYIPVGEGWSVDQYGFLFRATNSSVTGVLYDENGTEYTFNASGYSTPRYRLASGSSYNYTDLYFNPLYSNIVIEDTFAPVYDREYMVYLCIFAMLGVILVANLTHRR